MMGMGKMNLKPALFMIMGLLGTYIGIRILMLFGLTFIGAIAQVVQSGSIAVPTVINNSINTSINNTATGFTTLDTAIIFIFSLITLVTVIYVLYPTVKEFIGTGKKKSGGNNNF